MPVVVHCPACRGTVRVPDRLFHRKVRCPLCQHIFIGNPDDGVPADASPEPASIPVPPSNPFPEPAELPPPAPPIDPDAVACPGCGAANPRRRRSCQECGYNLRRDEDDDDDGQPRRRSRRRRSRDWDDDDRPWERSGRRDWEPHRGTLVLVLGALSLVLLTTVYFAFLATPLGIAAWVLGAIDLRKMEDGEMDPAGMSNTKAGYITGIIGTILGGLCGLGCGTAFFLSLLH